MADEQGFKDGQMIIPERIAPSDIANHAQIYTKSDNTIRGITGDGSDKQMIRSDDVDNIPKFSGDIYYVSPSGNDSNGGMTPDEPFLTIGHAISVLSVGDAITIKSGTYTETGLDLNVNSCELWFEIGVVLDPASGTSLTVSGDFCRLIGEHKITPAALAIGLCITGNECVISNCKILDGAIGIQVTGSGVILNDCAIGFSTSIAYDLQGIQGRLFKCKTVGNGATYGYKINGGVDTGVLEQCTSTGHATHGFFIGAGSRDWTILNCSSGGGDGVRLDTDDLNVWSNFSFDDEVFKEIIFAGVPTEYNIFKVTGAVRVIGLHSHIVSQIANTLSNLHVEAYSTNGTADMTDAPGSNIQNLVAGAILIRNGPASDVIMIADPSAGPAVAENAGGGPQGTQDTAIDVVKDVGADTYIRLVLSAALASGVIHWHCRYEPLTDDGFLEAA